MIEKENKNNRIKLYTQYSNNNSCSPKNITNKISLKKSIQSKKKQIIIFPDNNKYSLKRNDKEITESNFKINNFEKNMEIFLNKKDKGSKILIEDFSQEEKMMNNSVNINNINLINSMNNITFYDNCSNNTNKNIKSKNNNIKVNKKINFQRKKNVTDNKAKNHFKGMYYNNFGINFAVKGIKENNNIYNINQKIKEKEIYQNKKNISVNKNSTNMINVNKLSIKRTPLNNLKAHPNSTTNIFSLLQNNKKVKNNLSSPISIYYTFNSNKAKSEEKNIKKSKINSSKKFNKKNKYNLLLSNSNDKINNIIFTGNNTTTNKNLNKILLPIYTSDYKQNNKLNQKERQVNQNIEILSPTQKKDYKIQLNQSSPRIWKNEINNNIINSFEKIEVNKNFLMKNYLSKDKEKEKSIQNTGTRNNFSNYFLKKTHQNSWTHSTEKVNSNLDNINQQQKNEKENTPEKNSNKIIYNKKQLILHNKIKSCNYMNNILSPYNETKIILFEQAKEIKNNNKVENNLSDNLEDFSNSKDKIEINNFTYKKKSPLNNNIYRKPDLNFNNNSFLFFGNDALINKNNINKIRKENDSKGKYNAKLNKFLKQNDNSKERNELSILLNSENNNNSKEITMDTNIISNEISIINKINNKVFNNNNFIRKYYSYFIQLKKNKPIQSCFITKKRININNVKIKIPNNSICYLSKKRKRFIYIIPNIDVCYFRKDNILSKREEYYNKSKEIQTTKKKVNIEKYNKNRNDLQKTQKGLILLEKIADKRISLSSLLIKKNKKIFKDNDIKNDLLENLNIITKDNYDIILNNISYLIIFNNNKNNRTNINISQIIQNQNDLIDIIISKGIKEKLYNKIYAKLCKDLFISLMTIIDNKNDDIDIFDKLTKEKSIKNILKAKLIQKIEDSNNEFKDLFNFICELLENKILSIKIGFEFLDLLLKQYLNDLNDLNLIGIEILLTKMKKIIYEKNKFEHIQRYNKYIKNHLFNIFQKREKSNDLSKYLYYRLYNLLNNKNKDVIINREYNNDKFMEMIKSDLEKIIIMNKSSEINTFFSELKIKYDSELNVKKSFQLWELFYYYVEVCIDIIYSDNTIKLANEYINNVILNFALSIQNEVWEILHYKLILLFLSINDICIDNIYMYKIMGYLLYVLINNKLFYIKDLNNFLEKENYIVISIAKVVKYTIIFAEKNAKKFHNDFKQTKLFFGNNNFYNLVTVPLKKKFYEL